MSIASPRVRSTPARSLAGFGFDADRAGAALGLADFAIRRWRGRYMVDPFGGDAAFADLVLPRLGLLLPRSVEGVGAIAASGPALVIANRGLTRLEPAVLLAAVRDAGRRLRVVLPGAGALWARPARRLGAVRSRPDDLAAVLRGGHLAAIFVDVAPDAPLANPAPVSSWAPSGLLAAAGGVPVIPAAVILDAGLHAPRWRVRFGEPIRHEVAAHDPLAIAEVADAARASLSVLLRAPVSQ